jgi:Na+-transporting methylmalonyl-CoA/oxaloacetate decarboxylase gamma subunit
MSFATRFLLLVIIGIAIAAIGMHLTELFVGMAFLFGLMITFYGLPLLAVLFLLVLAWKLVWGIGGAKPKSVSQSKPEQVKQTKPTSHEASSRTDEQERRSRLVRSPFLFLIL